MSREGESERAICAGYQTLSPWRRGGTARKSAADTHRSTRQIEAESVAATMKVLEDVRRRPGKRTCSP